MNPEFTLFLDPKAKVKNHLSIKSYDLSYLDMNYC